MRLLLIHFHRPIRKRVAVIVAGDPGVRVTVVPIRAVRHVTARKNRAAVLDGNADDLRADGLHFQFVANGADQHAARRRSGPARDSADQFRPWIEHAGYRLGRLPVIPFVRNDAADRWRGAT